MILDRIVFEYQDKVLIEKMTIQTPYKYGAIFQDRGCFIYFKDKGPKLFSSEENTQVNKQEAVLLKCGYHFLDLIKQSDEEKIEIIVVHFHPEMLKKLYLKELPKIIERYNFKKRSTVVASHDIISKFIDSLEFYFQNPTLVNNDLLELKIKELILLLIQTENVESILELVSSLYSSRSVRLKDVVELHLFSNLSLQELAKLCNLSLSSFKREFKKEFNDSPNSYMISKKLDKAKELLSITDMPINHIAFEIGFNDPLYFTRQFKTKVGLSPTNYRSMNSL